MRERKRRENEGIRTKRGSPYLKAENAPIIPLIISSDTDNRGLIYVLNNIAINLRGLLCRGLWAAPVVSRG